MVEELFRLTKNETGLLSQDAYPDMSATYPKYTELYRYQAPVDRRLIFRPGHTFSIYAKYLNENADAAGWYRGGHYETNMRFAVAGVTSHLLNAVPLDDDFTFFGYRYKFKSIYPTLVAANVNDADLDPQWDYYNGAGWSDLPGLTDGTNGFSTGAGAVEVSWTLPGNWAPYTGPGPKLYYIRRTVATYVGGTVTFNACKVHNSQVVDNLDMFKLEVRDQNELVRKQLIQPSQYLQVSEFQDRDLIKRLDIADEVVAEPGNWIVISVKAIAPVDVSECYFDLTCSREMVHLF